MVIRWLLAGWLACLALPVAADAPRRVVSVNLCTDQLAMMLAAPGQLVSVSYLARDPASSAMPEAAAGLPLNHGLAEEIFLLRPDLVLAGTWTTPATVDLLRRVGVPVAVFQPEDDLAGIRANIRRMGEVLGREAEAEALIARFEADLARLDDAPAPRPRAAIYAANGYTLGSDSLAGQIVILGGHANIADELGLAGGGTLPLESLLLSQPDLLILGRRYPGHSRGEDMMDHPALRSVMRDTPFVVMSDPDWVCGTPRILRAAQSLRTAGGLAP
ncbi:iron complex transport system substrate-binding protein [Paracoccus aminovorans]|uniref:Iron complex transport system substrate-binding protein n=1 Tax=Paracoccus aminovorans TaxID=34004 RepID=A0A1I3CXY5_9RHOB|nr:ABC transporter substrate-binding protein [Paracoccus aminovorans]CQR83800.1 putative cobalamin ABC transporter substrate-binding protein [Paracoccus aminovorans]SFH79374.1 iron complex transport system substrate-binding protein [Paracoccus aminovorans]